MAQSTTSLNELALFLTIEQTARVLEISRTAAYALANEWLRTAGQVGIPVVRLGRTLRVPRTALERLQNGQSIEPDPTPPVSA